MLDFLKRLFGQFDSHGLKYSVAHLRRVREEIPFWEIEIQCKYADAVCVDIIDNKISEHAFALLHISDSLTWQELLSYMNQEGVGSYYNTTTIGNAAYVGLYHWDRLERERAKKFLSVYSELCSKY